MELLPVDQIIALWPWLSLVNIEQGERAEKCDAFSFPEHLAKELILSIGRANTETLKSIRSQLKFTTARRGVSALPASAEAEGGVMAHLEAVEEKNWAKRHR
jgi:hypothetical protein